MNKGLGRNDPCSCGSGKKFKQCCMNKTSSSGKRKLTAKWLNAPEVPNLMERTFGRIVSEAEKAPFQHAESENDAYKPI